MPSAEIGIPKKSLHRSNSLHSELSTNSTQSKKVVSFNRDVAIKRIPRGERSGSVKLIAVVRPNAPESSTNQQQRLWINDQLISSPTPPDQILKEAQSIIDNVNRIECSSNSGNDKAKSQSKFSSLFTRTLSKPNRLGRSNSEVPITRSNRRITNEPERQQPRPRTAESVSRDFIDVNSRRNPTNQWNGRVIANGNGSGSADECADSGMEQWRGRIRKPPHPRANLRGQQEGSSGSDTRSTPPRDFSRTSHFDADLPLSKQRTAPRKQPSPPKEQLSKYQHFSSPQTPASTFTLPERVKESSEIIYAHILSNGGDRSKQAYRRDLQFSPEALEALTRESSKNYAYEDEAVPYREQGSIYRSPSYRNNVSSVLLNSVEETEPPPRPFFYGDSLDGKYFNSSSLDSSSPEPTPTPTSLKLVQEMERRSYLHEPARLEYMAAINDFAESDEETPRPLTDDPYHASRNLRQASNQKSTRIHRSASLGYSMSTNDKALNELNCGPIPETKSGGFISTLMRRNKKHSNQTREGKFNNALPPKPTKKPNKFLSLFTGDRTNDKHKIEKQKITENSNGGKKPIDINIIPNGREFIGVDEKRKNDGFYIQSRKGHGNDFDRSIKTEKLGNEMWTQPQLKQSQKVEMYETKEPLNHSFGLIENGLPQFQSQSWEPDDYRLNMAMCKSQRPIHEAASSTLGRPDKQSTHYTSRSKSLDRRNTRRNDTHVYHDRWVVPEELILVREQNKLKGNNKFSPHEPAEDRITSSHHCDTDDGAETNLRYFGDSNIQNYTTMKSRDKVNERPPILASKEVYLHRGNTGSSLLHGISSSGSETAGGGGGRLSSSSGSSRSVYLHAPAVAEIPPSITRTLSRDEINNSSNAVKQYRRLARSASVLAPWRPHVYFVEQ